MHLLAAHLDASVDQLRRHFRKIDSGFEPYVQEYVRYKSVCSELLMAYLGFAPDGDAVDWAAFAASQSDDPYAASVGMRSDLAAVAQDLVQR